MVRGHTLGTAAPSGRFTPARSAGGGSVVGEAGVTPDGLRPRVRPGPQRWWARPGTSARRAPTRRTDERLGDGRLGRRPPRLHDGRRAPAPPGAARPDDAAGRGARRARQRPDRGPPP